MKQETKELREKAERAKFMLHSGLISLREAKEEAQPFIDHANEVARRVAKEYNLSPRLMNVSSFLR